MKHLTHIFSNKRLKPAVLLLLMAGFVIVGCKDDEGEDTPKFALVSIKANDLELAEGTTTTGVAVDADFVATFNKDLREESYIQGDGCISISSAEDTRGIDMSYQGSGNTVSGYVSDGFVNKIILENNTTYTLTINCAISGTGETLPAIVRTFTTEE